MGSGVVSAAAAASEEFKDSVRAFLVTIDASAFRVDGLTDRLLLEVGFVSDFFRTGDGGDAVAAIGFLGGRPRLRPEVSPGEGDVIAVVVLGGRPRFRGDTAGSLDEGGGGVFTLEGLPRDFLGVVASLLLEALDVDLAYGTIDDEFSFFEDDARIELGVPVVAVDFVGDDVIRRVATLFSVALLDSEVAALHAGQNHFFVVGIAGKGGFKQNV